MPAADLSLQCTREPVREVIGPREPEREHILDTPHGFLDCRTLFGWRLTVTTRRRLRHRLLPQRLHVSLRRVLLRLGLTHRGTIRELPLKDLLRVVNAECCEHLVCRLILVQHGLACRSGHCCKQCRELPWLRRLSVREVDIHPDLHCGRYAAGPRNRNPQDLQDHLTQ